jgi:hypothetical protein
MPPTSGPVQIAYPALEPHERLFLEVNGYVVLHNVLGQGEVDELRAAIYSLEESVRGSGHLPHEGLPSDPNACSVVASSTRGYFNIENIPHLHPAFLRYCLHPRLTGVMQEMVGSAIRLEQSDVHIRRQSSDDTPDETFGFHGGRSWEMSRSIPHISNGIYRCPFVKALTNLTDLHSPTDGGTMVIAGSHKIDPSIDTNDVIAAALADPEQRNVHQVVAPAGSTLCFHETLIHSSGNIRSGKDRLLIISGWSPSHYQPYHAGFEPDPALLGRLPAMQAELLSGSRRWNTQLGAGVLNGLLSEPRPAAATATVDAGGRSNKAKL